MNKVELLKNKLEQKEILDSEILALRREIFKEDVYGKIRKGSVCKCSTLTFVVDRICINLNQTVSLNGCMGMRLEDIEVVEY